LALIIGVPAFANDMIRLTIGEWPPYISKDLKYYGVVPRIITEAFALEGITVEYGFFNWKRAFEISKSGKEWDGSAVWSISKDREQFFIFSDPVIEKSVVFFHLKSTKFDWERIEDLKDITIGATLGYDYGDLFQKAEKDGMITTERVVSDKQNFEKLLGRRFLVFVSNITAGYSMLNKMYDPDTVGLFTNNPKPVNESYNALILSKKNPHNQARILIFNQGLKKLRQSGKYDQFCKESRQGEYKLK